MIKTLFSHLERIAVETVTFDELMESTIGEPQRQIEVDEPDDEELSLLVGEGQRGKEDNADDSANEDLLRALMDAQTSEDK